MKKKEYKGLEMNVVRIGTLSMLCASTFQLNQGTEYDHENDELL